MIPKMIIDNGLDPRGISRDAKVVEDYKQDPLNHEKISLYTARKIFNLQDKFVKAGQFKTGARILMVHGGSDLMTLVDASRNFFSRSLEWDKRHKFICVEGGYHECNKHKLKCSAF
jgi:alpha-beta hydrolase superfamily lysophospholipase